VSARDFGDELLRRLLQVVLESVPGALGAGVGLPGRAVAGLGVAARLDPAQWAADAGPLPDAVAGAGVTVLPALPTPQGEPDTGATLDWAAWPALPPELGPELSGVRGVVATPGEWGGDTPVIFSVYLDRRPDAAVLEQVDRLEPMLAQALAVVEYCAGEELRAQQMLEMVQYRRVIEQAKGMIMTVLGQDAGTAFNALARASQHFNVRLRSLAVALVEQVGSAPAEGPDDPEQAVEPSDADRRIAAQVWAALRTDGKRAIGQPAGG